jgi:hypothetical protein
MKQLREQNLGINFLSAEEAGKLNSLDGHKLWAVRAIVISEFWESPDGTAWYRRYSDGWLEQGGTLTATGITVTLPAEFANANYTLITGFTGLESSSSSIKDHTQAGVKTTTSFYIRTRYGADIHNYSSDWMAFGMGTE